MKLLQLTSKLLVLLRCLLVLGAGLTTAALAASQLVQITSRPAPESVDDLIVMAAAVAALICLTWLGVLAAVVVAEALTDAVVGRRRGPAGGVRRLVLGLCGLLATVPMATAHAEEASSDALSEPTVVAGLPFPDRLPDRVPDLVPDRVHDRTPEPEAEPEQARSASPSPQATQRIPAEIEQQGPAPEPEPEPVATAARYRTVTVQAGDTLWSLSRDALGSGAEPGAITAGWQSIHRINRTVIGEDPSLILPGQRLRIPADLSGTSQEQP